MFKKATCLREARSSKAAGLRARETYTAVREHGKRPRTPLVDFFNILREGTY